MLGPLKNAAMPLIEFIDGRILSIGAALKARDLPFQIRQLEVNKVVRELSLFPGRAFHRPDDIDTLGMILFASRAGSSWLGHLLGSTGRTNRIAEEMRPNRLSKFAAKHNIGDLAECVERVMQSHSVDGFYGFKGGALSLVPFVYSGAFEECHSMTKAVLLSRRDVIGQSISIRKAKLTGVWHARGRRNKAQPEVGVECYSYRDLLDGVRSIARANSALKEFVVHQGFDHIEVHYEDVCADPAGEVNRILGFFGRDPVAGDILHAEHRVLRDKTNDVWAVRFREDMAKRPSDRLSLEKIGVRLKHAGF